jgi:hypothetical protein
MLTVTPVKLHHVVREGLEGKPLGRIAVET